MRKKRFPYAPHLPTERLPLTDRQMQVYTLVLDGFKATGKSPKLQDMAEKLGLTKVGVWHHINDLRHKGWVGTEHKKRQSITPLPYLLELIEQAEAEQAAKGLPVMGHVEDDDGA